MLVLVHALHRVFVFSLFRWFFHVFFLDKHKRKEHFYFDKKNIRVIFTGECSIHVWFFYPKMATNAITLAGQAICGKIIKLEYYTPLDFQLNETYFFYKFEYAKYTFTNRCIFCFISAMFVLTFSAKHILIGVKMNQRASKSVIGREHCKNRCEIS